MGKEKMTLSRMVSVCAVLLCGSCTTATVEKPPNIERLSDAEKREVGELVAPRFRFADEKKEEAFSVVYAARRLLSDGARVVAVQFKDSRHATIFVTAAAGSMHGSPSINAVWDEGEWKFGHWWYPA